MSAGPALWRVPALDAAPPPRPPSIQDLQQIEEQARQAGFEAGRREGFTAGQAEVQRLVAQFEAVVEAFARPLGRLEDDVQAALGQLAVRIAGALLGRAYEADPALLAQLVRTALDAVGDGQRPLELRLNPADAERLAPWLPQWADARVVPDPQIGPGEARVHGDGVRIDARMEARLQAALAAVGHGGGTP